MLTTTLAKIRERFGLAPNASLSQIDEAIDAEVAATTEAEATAEEAGADAGAEEAPSAKNLELPGTPPGLEKPEEKELTIETVTGMIAEAIAPMKQAITDLNAVNATLTTRIEAIEATDAEAETAGVTEVAAVDPPKSWENNPINARVAQQLNTK